MCGNDVMELLYQIHLERAAYASVLQGHQTVILHTYHASLLDKAGVNVYLTYVIDNDGKLYAFAVAEYPVDQCGLSAA